MSLRAERGQALVMMTAAGVVLLLAVGVLAALGQGLLGRARAQRAADLAAISAARAMRDDFGRLFEPPRLPGGAINPRHMTKAAYLEGARVAAIEGAQLNGADAKRVQVSFPDCDSFAPTRVRVALRGEAKVRADTAGRPSSVPVRASAVAEVAGAGGTFPEGAEGGGYDGPLAYRQGKPMRPDVARAFDRLHAAAHADGVELLINSGYRSDAEQARLYAQHPDPHWVAPPGRSLHRYGTELDLGPPSAYGWLARNATRFHFHQRYAWEPWHYGYGLNPRSAPRTSDGRSAVPSFVPAAYADQIARAASRWNISAALIAAQLYVESNFNPFAVSGAGARGIAQFMPGTARTYGLLDPFDAAASISAQAHLMRDLLRRFGSVSLALAAYNAGAGAVEACGCVPPYPETQAYVTRILGLMGGAIALPDGAGFEVRLVS
jgi:Transglycosylase SLT domain/D-alanyl-D-alanine carboxypeptidase/Putative Flp pilus-assembly TadE/G-like